MIRETPRYKEEEKRKRGSGEGANLFLGLHVYVHLVVKATIKTYAVTYEGKSVTEVSAPKWARIPVHYRTMLSRQLGGILITTGYITARELFRARPNFREEEEMVYFVEETKVSYLGEDVQILKEKQKVD